ncbi:hypothetical protein GHT06_015782 [Daphnia sinensis]|uniref:Uncharacterized protein n=1 Tax=Daphnia sinensis TaxID=1820382 RepID=A0AAD5LJR5_9CRUS|nr:hypothetical protein GHT06_015782 [Daphnia sinensis]
MTLLGAAFFGGVRGSFAKRGSAIWREPEEPASRRPFCLRVFVSQSSRLLNKRTQHNHKIYFDRQGIRLQSISSFGCITDRRHRRPQRI